MTQSAACRQIRQSWRHTGSGKNRRSAVNTGFHGYFPCDLHRSVRIKDDVKIDPPYNRGKDDFVYDDNYVGTEDSFKHSKWLSFMEKRLRIAYSLLSEDGLMFVSIDDNEQAALKNLIDEIFSEDNFIIAMPRITKKSGKTTGSFSKNHDYVLVYTKQNKDIFVMEEHIDPAFQYEDEWVEDRGKYKLNQTLDYDSLSYSASLDYPLTVDGETFYPGGDISAWQERQNGNHRRADWAWRWNQKLFDSAKPVGIHTPRLAAAMPFRI